MWLQGVNILREKRLLDSQDQALVGQVEAIELDLDRFLVQEVVPLLFGVVPDGLVRIQHAGIGEGADGPAIRGVPRDGDSAFRQ